MGDESKDGLIDEEENAEEEREESELIGRELPSSIREEGG